MKKNLILLFLTGIAWVAMATGCNTVHGVGRDVEKAGDHIQDSAERHR